MTAYDFPHVLNEEWVLFSRLAMLASAGADQLMSAASIAALTLGGVSTAIALIEIKKAREAQNRLDVISERDPLTDLPHRSAVRSRLSAALERAAALGESLAVLHIDFDNFKDLNDNQGQAAGDALLRAAARRLAALAAQPAFAGRIAGDEFVVVQGAQADSAGAASQLAGDILEALSEPIEFDGKVLSLHASIGVALFPQDGDTAESLIAHAGAALDLAKNEARGGWRFFSRDTDEAMRQRRQTARELRAAIAEGGLVVHYQPLARTPDAEVCGFEALVRWNHPVRGMVPPLEFIPLAEEMGLIGPLGEWVLRKACADAATWERPLNVAVNLSAVQLHETELPARVQEILLQTGLAPHRLELEVTETALIHDTQRALDVLRRVKALGVRIAMDDFGTGFSSLSTLQSFPFDKLKIDKSFVGSIHRDDRSTAIVKAVLGLGRSLDIPVTAEGVETQAQLEFLRAELCAQVQGWLIGRPAPVEQIGSWTGPEGPAALRVAS
jgi:diguanylate cyclase (GGDEF)-like protein